MTIAELDQQIDEVNKTIKMLREARAKLIQKRRDLYRSQAAASTERARHGETIVLFADSEVVEVWNED